MSLPGLLDEMAARWAVAREHPTATTRDLRIAGVDVRVTVAGEALAAIAQAALAAHEPADGTPSAEVGAWDAAAVGVPLPDRPPGLPEVARWSGTRDGAAVAEVALAADGSMRAADRDEGRYLLGVPSVAEMSSWERGAPLRRQLLWALWPQAQLIHAAGVSTGDGVAMIVGRSGAGKSSTAMACAQAGLGFLGDDHCAVTAGDPPTVHHLHASARLVPHELDHLAAEAADGRVDIDKALVWPDRLGSPIPRSGPLRVVLLVEALGEREPVLEPMRPSDLLRQIAPSMLRQQHIDPGGELRGLRQVLGSVPVRRLRLAVDRAANPPVIARAIADPGWLSGR